MAGVTGDSADPTALAWRFSPVSNDKRDRIRPDDELRVLIATDVLSEGQNLQDCCRRRQLRPALGHHPPDPARAAAWTASARRPRRSSATRSCRPMASSGSSGCAPACASACRRTPRSSAPTRRSSRTTGTTRSVVDLYNEKAGILDGDADDGGRSGFYAYQIWKNAIDTRSRHFRRSFRTCRQSSSPPARTRPRKRPA